MTREDKLALIADDSIRDLDLVKGADSIGVKITEDGRYRAEVVGSISSVNHGNAATFLKDIAAVLGGALKITRTGKHAHHHHHHHGTHSH